VPVWIDPFFGIQGSSIEKMVMAELVRRGIYFEHTIQVNPLPWLSWMRADKSTQNWEPDFLFPQYKIWLEIQGAYFHTLPGQIETDALRFAYIEAVGWKPIAWWEDDIRNRLQDLFNGVPEFYRVEQKLQDGYPLTAGLPFYEGGIGIDHLAGLRKALRNRARPPQNIVKRYKPKRRPK
jgi:hypothetical protein